jgi:L-ascorbate metabolism protein UlaG (beta-lactamase superfamily)
MSEETRPVFTWLGHATVRCDLPGREVVLIDPFLEGNPRAPEAAAHFNRLDLILVTHAHSDHMGDAIALARRYDALVVATFDLCQWFASQGVKRVSGMNVGGTQRQLGLAITQVRADHSSGFLDDGKLVYGGIATGYVVRLPSGYTFYHSGDTALFSDMRLIGELWEPQLAFLPIGDHFTMDPLQAARACELLEVPRVVPIHWGTFPLLTGTPEALRAALREAGADTEVVELTPGKPWRPPAD